MRKIILLVIGAWLAAANPASAQWVSGGGGSSSGVAGGDLSGTYPNPSVNTLSGGSPIAPSATTDTTNATNITSGTLDGARLPATINQCPAVIDTWDGTAAKTIGATVGIVYTIGSTQVAAGRALNLPTVASWTLGCPLTVIDLAGIFNATNVVTPTRQSSDTIDGATTGTTLGAPHQSVTWTPTVATKWATVAPPTLASDVAVTNQFVTAIPDTGIVSRAYPPLQPIAITYPPGINPTSMPIANFSEARTIIGIRCNPEVLAGGAATISVYKAPSATALSAGTNLTDSASCNANSGVATDQNLTTATGANWVLAPGDRLGLITTGTTIWTSSGVATGVVTVFVR